ncbi:MAG TPA: sugar porter family MFS transporter [Frankiaceae bacterium]|nr:sugar porter family transporter [Mycobacterium sp.]
MTRQQPPTSTAGLAVAGGTSRPRDGAPRRAVRRASVVTAVGGILFGYDTGVIAGALTFIAKDFHLGSFMKSTVTAVLLLGAMLGAMIAGRLADLVGRRTTVLITAITAAVGVLGSIFTPDTFVLIVARIILGLAVGSASVVVPLYIGEIAPPAVRGRLVSLNQLAITVGILAAGLVDYFLATTANWRLMIGFALVPAILLGLGTLTTPESPHWLLRRNRPEEARAVLQRLREPGEVDAELAEVEETARATASFSEVFSARVRPALLVGVALAAIQQVTGINTVIYYAPTLLENAGVGTHAALLGTVLIGVINVALTVVSLRLLDRTGRRPLLLGGTAGMIVGLVVLGSCFAATGDLHGTVLYVALAALMFYVGSFAIGLGPVFWLLIAEIYPLRVRGQAIGVATFVNWLANFAVAETYLSLLDNLGKAQTFYLYAGITVFSLVFLWRRVPETKGRPLAAIERDLGSAPTEARAA